MEITLECFRWQRGTSGKVMRLECTSAWIVKGEYFCMGQGRFISIVGEKAKALKLPFNNSVWSVVVGMLTVDSEAFLMTTRKKINLLAQSNVDLTQKAGQRFYFNDTSSMLSGEMNNLILYLPCEYIEVFSFFSVEWKNVEKHFPPAIIIFVSCRAKKCDKLIAKRWQTRE